MLFLISTVAMTAPTPRSASTCAANWPGSSSTCVTAVAVCMAESSGSCSAKYVNSGGSIDRGLWQINDYWHPEVSDSCAYDCSCNGKGALSISSSGNNWSPWATYNSGAYRSHLSEAEAACGAKAKMTAPTPRSASTCAAAWPGSSSTCVTAVAVCMAESSGSCSARHTNAGGTIDRGLWQINDYYHPEVSDSCAYDCSCNGKGALSISSSGSNWSPWATYNSGAYRSHLSEAEAVCGAKDKVIKAK